MRHIISRRKWDEKRYTEVLWKGSFLGLVLWTSSVLWISIAGQMDLAESYFSILPMIITGYVFAGILIQWLYTMPGKENIWLKRPALMYWIILVFMLVFAEQLIPYEIRPIINVNLAVLLVIWLGDFFLSETSCQGAERRKSIWGAGSD
ncbi:hypothetical protein [Clostridium sp. AM58-1XD]|uniref:hypothetical protein n=1 Tax=Clostridium sp. AM58-1XD TaxID=2292307 RepID=UPI000E47550F|nr:hypothetical protein [Clostridium sp. AM58-1XD]RGY98386.1 hypothetical protein DXA13_11295 [Clostridium sp. AM58-1XD]